jgi:hypothetical protein
MKALTVEDLVPPACGSVNVFTTRKSEANGLIAYRLVVGGITRGKVLAIPDLGSRVLCWHCTLNTTGRYVVRNSEGYVTAVESACKLCYQLRIRGLSGPKLWEAIVRMMERWLADRQKYHVEVLRWKDPIAIRDKLRAKVGEEASLRAANVAAMMAKSARQLAALRVKDWPVPEGWVDPDAEDLLARLEQIGDLLVPPLHFPPLLAPPDEQAA